MEIQVRRFGSENKIPVPRAGVRGLAASVIQLPSRLAASLSPAQFIERYGGKPIVTELPTAVVSLYFEPVGEMDEHAAPFPILFLVISGEGFVRVGGPESESIKVTVGEAFLWPPNIPHKAWTGEEAMQAITIEYPIK